jgi:hypothetical protein
MNGSAVTDINCCHVEFFFGKIDAHCDFFHNFALVIFKADRESCTD